MSVAEGQGPRRCRNQKLGEEDLNPQCLDQNQMCYQLHHPRRATASYRFPPRSHTKFQQQRCAEGLHQSVGVAEPVVDTSITEDPPKRHRGGLTRHLPQRCSAVCW